MIMFGHILFWIGLIVWLVGTLMFLAIVFRYSLIWFFGCLFVPFADVIYFFLYPKQTWKPMLIAAIGFLATGAGYWIGGFSFLR